MNRKKTILIIDDDDRNIFALKAVLVAKGFECLSATSGQQALTMLEEKKNISVALVDMMMPGMDGYELMALVRENNIHNDVRLIAVTAQAMIGDMEKCLAAGAEAYVSKPVDVDVLLQYLND
jgi:two-component system, cell cycle response regulator DivK